MALQLDGIPVGAEVGIDLKSWEIGPRFRGIGRIPSGTRLLHVSVHNGISTGMFIKVDNENSRFAFCWNEGALDKVEIVDNQEGYGMYEETLQWSGLVGYLHDHVLSRCGIVMSTTLDHVRFTELPEVMAAAQRAREGCEVSKQFLAEEDFTRLIRDPSKIFLKGLVLLYGGDFELFLGEMQLSFILFLYVSNFSALQFWKQAVHLACTSLSWQKEATQDAFSFVHVLSNQVAMLPRDFFQDELLQDSFLTPAFASILSNENLRDEIAPVIKSHHGQSVLKRLTFWEEEDDAAFQLHAFNMAIEAKELPLVEDEISSRVNQSQNVERMSWMLPPSN